MQNISNKPNVSKTIDLVAKKIGFIKDCRGKNLVVFIGREQVGKSTTINALLGTKFQFDERNVIPCPGEQFHAPMGSDERVGLMCTVYPAVYHDTENDIYYLDTQGFFGTDKNPEEVAAASVLLDAAIKSASSIRIVYVEDFETFYKGLTRVQDVVKLLNRVVLSENVPIFFLYNRYNPTRQMQQKFFNLTDEQKNAIAEEEIGKSGAKLVASAHKQTQDLLEKNNRNSNSSNHFAHNASTNEILRIMDNDDNENNGNNNRNETYNEIIEEENAAYNAYDTEKSGEIIDLNFKEKRYGYVDVLSDWSINNLKQNIMRLPTVDKSNLSFNCCDSSRIKFTRGFEEKLRSLVDSINNVFFSIRFPPPTINELIDKNNAEKIHNEKLLNDLENGEEIDISYLLNNIKEEKEQKLNEYQKLQDQLSDVKNQIYHIKCASPVKYADYPFDDPVGFFTFWRNHEVKYNEDLPFVGVEENLAEGTFRDKIIKFDIDRFNEYWDSQNQRTLLKIKDDESPIYNFKVKYTSASKGRKAKTAIAYVGGAIAGGILGFFGLLPLCLPLGAAIGLSTKKRNCTGVISFYARYQDKESDTLERLKENKNKLKKLITKNLEEIDEINKNINESQRQILNASIAQMNDNIAQLNEILIFVNRILEIWNLRRDGEDPCHSMLEELTTYNEIALMLYPPPVNNESVKNYMKFFNRLINASQVTRNITTTRVINEYRTRNIYVINSANNRTADNSNDNANDSTVDNSNDNENDNENNSTVNN